jgi:hypothetical protein
MLSIIIALLVYIAFIATKTMRMVLKIQEKKLNNHERY